MSATVTTSTAVHTTTLQDLEPAVAGISDSEAIEVDDDPDSSPATESEGGEDDDATSSGYKDGQYLIPNDDSEQDRLDLQHEIFFLTFDNNLFLSPAGRNGEEIRRVLDIGTGTGIWALDFAYVYPDSTVIGVDLSPIQSAAAPPNVSFQIDDIEEPWTFEQKFDFIYCRMMTIGIADWPRLFEQSYENLEPGGWIEVVDIAPLTADDDSLKEDSALHKWITTLTDCGERIGRTFRSASRYKEQLEAQGFENVVEVKFKWPQNRWPRDKKLKELGGLTLENIGSIVCLESISAAAYTRLLGWTKPELDVFLRDVRRDMKDRNIHTYWPIYVVYGQKPRS
ncbi:S-adenosyl-L-methionine-dependent methyltransferase [Plectosphaerella cucumerina]|uniref:S-adenosyl-L-methionine-dependent methyltransferase n=1 Tax=Plectosphaerella cucumerina TaxID=40658 RepID=A0A8K0X5S4_9PEZI|nr:S-adenosyl-L-methionine-dependent methyltransferase [Plectosphaerella cucumerina]